MALVDTVLTETIIDVSDQHSVPDISGAACILSFTSEQDYCDLHRRIFATPRRCIGYREVHGAESNVLDQLCLGYMDVKFWHYIVNDSFATYPRYAWRKLLPLVAFLKPRIEFTKASPAFEIKPKTSVLLY